jgi:hypothetical protein
MNETACGVLVNRPTIEAEAGWMGFADDGIVNESFVGGTARW